MREKMKLGLSIILALVFLPTGTLADTPPSGTVKAKMFTGDGVTGLTSTGTSLNVNVTNSSGGSTVNQGTAGVDPWLVTGTVAGTGTFNVAGTFWQATQPVSGPLTNAQLRAADVPVSGTFWQATQPVSIATMPTTPVTGTFWQATQPVSIASVPLPSGAATESTLLDVKANTADAVSGIVAGNVSSASIDSKTPSLGQALASGSVPVVLPAAQITTLTPPTTITANAGSGTFTVDGSGHTQPVSGTFWQATQPVSIATMPTTPVTGTFWQATQPVSGPLTDAQLRAADVPVSGTFWQATQPVSLATAPALVAGSAIIGKVGIDQTTPGTTNGVQVNAALPAGSNVIGHVVVDSAPSTAVTNAGTFATQATLSAETTKVIGTVNISSGQTVGLAAGSQVIGHVVVDTAPTTAVTQSGTFTVQPGNTANTTAWLVNAVPKTPAAATVKQAAITVGTSAVRLTNDGSAPPSTRVLLVAQLLSSSTANCFFGSSGVTTTSTTRGVQMLAGQTLSFNNDAGDYYAICDASSQTILITEQE